MAHRTVVLPPVVLPPVEPLELEGLPSPAPDPLPVPPPEPASGVVIVSPVQVKAAGPPVMATRASVGLLSRRYC